MINKNVPRLRFKIFKNNWEEDKLINIASFHKGKGYSKNDLIDRGYPIILYGSLYTNYQTKIHNADMFVREKKDTDVLSKKGDVIVPASGETPADIARATNIDNDGIILGGDLNIIHPNTKTLNSSFLALTITFGKTHIKLSRVAQGNSIVHLQNHNLKKINIPFPSLPEQQHISNFFSKLDHLIDLHSQKLEQLKKLKRGYLQKMFPQKGEMVPRLRFNGFSGEWKEVKVGEIFKVGRGQVLAKNKISDIKTNVYKYPVYSSQTYNNGLLGYYDEYLYDSDITWTTDGANAGTVMYRDGKFYSTNVNGVLHSDEGYGNVAIANIINSVAFRYVSHVGNPKLMNNVMSQIRIRIPEINEQKRISEFLTTIDNNIRRNLEMIDALKQQKKAYLQKMFI